MLDIVCQLSNLAFYNEAKTSIQEWPWHVINCICELQLIRQVWIVCCWLYNILYAVLMVILQLSAASTNVVTSSAWVVCFIRYLPYLVRMFMDTHLCNMHKMPDQFVLKTWKKIPQDGVTKCTFCSLIRFYRTYACLIKPFMGIIYATSLILVIRSYLPFFHKTTKFASNMTLFLVYNICFCNGWLGDRKGIRPLKNWVVGCWHGYLSGARCGFAYGLADATATYYLLLQ